MIVSIPVNTKHLYNIYTMLIQRVGTALYKCYTNVLCLLGCSTVLDSVDSLLFMSNGITWIWIILCRLIFRIPHCVCVWYTECLCTMPNIREYVNMLTCVNCFMTKRPSSSSALVKHWLSTGPTSEKLSECYDNISPPYPAIFVGS